MRLGPRHGVADLPMCGSAPWSATRKCVLALGGPELPGAERAARELVEMVPFRESGHLLLMRALAARSNVAEALAAYERLRILLRDEMGVDPGEAVQEAYLRLLG